MSWVDDVNSSLTDALSGPVSYDEGFGPPTFDVPAAEWISALSALRAFGFSYFDWLTAVDELDSGFTVACHLAALRGPGAVEHVLVRTRVPKSASSLPTATGVFAGASWHERETHEMFGVDFVGHPSLAPLLLPDEFEGHPLRKDFVLAARVAKAWPGAKEPGESDHDTGRSPSRRRVAPPGVPGPEAWGPRPPGSPTPDPTALTTPARPARRERGERAERPARPARTPSDRPPRPTTAEAPGGESPTAAESPGGGTPSGVPPTAAEPSGGERPTSVQATTAEPPGGETPTSEQPTDAKSRGGERPTSEQATAAEPTAGETPTSEQATAAEPPGGETPTGERPSPSGEGGDDA